MSYARITIDGDTIIDTNLNTSQQHTPTELAKLITPQTRQQPGMMALLLAFGTAIKTSQDITANLRNRASGYTLTVDHGPHIIEATA